MASNKGRNNPWVNFFIIVLIVALVATFIFLPEEVIRQTAGAEREQMLLWTGKSASDWVGMRSEEFMRELSEEYSKLTIPDMNQTFKDWITNRLYTSLLWYDVFVYRMFSAVIWFLIISPLFMAASVDGYYLREIRKSMFISQSPLRLRIGSIFLILSMIGIFAWLLIPLPVPVLTAPLLIILMAFSCWIWTANLQKRI